MAQTTGMDVLNLNEALEELEKARPGQSRVVELRFFGGFSIEEAAAAMDVSPKTVKREWIAAKTRIAAKTWIHRRMLRREREG